MGRLIFVEGGECTARVLVAANEQKSDSRWSAWSVGCFAYLYLIAWLLCWLVGLLVGRQAD